jgi:nidogen (entactin)
VILSIVSIQRIFKSSFISRKVYWTDWNRDAPKIESINMDGTGRKVVIQENLGLPNALTLDHERRRLCWGDAGK